MDINSVFLRNVLGDFATPAAGVHTDSWFEHRYGGMQDIDKFFNLNIRVPTIRDERRLLDFNQCTAEELIKFAFDRKLIQKASRDAKKELLVDLLQAADRKRKFRFMDLPPELRCLIYDYYLSTFPKLVLTSFQPPLSKTCKLVRTELLPLLYESFQFQFRIERFRGPDFAFDFDFNTHRLLRAIQPHLLDKIRHTLFIITSPVDDVLPTAYEFEVILKSGEDQGASGVSLKRTLADFPQLGPVFSAPGGQGTQAARRVFQDQVPERIKQYSLDFVERRASDRKLNKEDVYRMPGEIQQAVFEVHTVTRV